MGFFFLDYGYFWEVLNPQILGIQSNIIWVDRKVATWSLMNNKETNQHWALPGSLTMSWQTCWHHSLDSAKWCHQTMKGSWRLSGISATVELFFPFSAAEYPQNLLGSHWHPPRFMWTSVIMSGYCWCYLHFLPSLPNNQLSSSRKVPFGGQGNGSSRKTVMQRRGPSKYF